MSINYKVMTADDIPDYVCEHEKLLSWGALLGIQEISDGYLNNVYRVHCERGSFVLKQSMPYVRVDPSWPLTPERIVQEAISYRTWNEVTAGFAPEVYLFDERNFVLVEEDLVDHEIWRQALNDGRPHVDSASALGRFAAQVAVNATVSAMARHGATEDLGVNPIMRRLMEDVIFEFPYTDHPSNSYSSSVSGLVAELRNNVRFRDNVSELHGRWTANREALIHGDLHTGSVMVAPGSTKVIDAEFSLFGPVSWDLGELLGNLLLGLIRAELLNEAQDVKGMPAALWDSFVSEVRSASPESGEFGPAWLRRTQTEMCGYAGLEMIRRVIGSGKAADLTTLPDEMQGHAAHVALAAGRSLVEQRTDLTASSCVILVQRVVNGIGS